MNNYVKCKWTNKLANQKVDLKSMIQLYVAYKKPTLESHIQTG